MSTQNPTAETPSRGAHDVSTFEVSPRDGLQNEAVVLTVDQRVALIDRLSAVGFTDIEIGSFVSPKWIPQLANTADVFARIEKRPGTRYWALVPNRKGLERAVEAGLQHIAVFMSVSETHNFKNIHRTVAESLEEQRQVISDARSQGMQVRAYLSTVFGCPFEGAVSPSRAIELAHALSEAGAWQISLGDTVGVGHPHQVTDIVGRIKHVVPLEQVALHFHDTCGMALVNVWAGLQAGVRTFDSSMGGIGGCPYAPGAAGNLATEDLINFMHGQGFRTQVTLENASTCGVFLRELLGRPLPGRYHSYYVGSCQRKGEPQH